MFIFNKILFVFYLVMAVLIAGFIVWNTYKSKKITEKVIGAITLIMFALRILMIK